LNLTTRIIEGIQYFKCSVGNCAERSTDYVGVNIQKNHWQQISWLDDEGHMDCKHIDAYVQGSIWFQHLHVSCKIMSHFSYLCLNVANGMPEESIPAGNFEQV
jgi:hypothetical protein